MKPSCAAEPNSACRTEAGWPTHDALFRAFQLRADVIVHLGGRSPVDLRYFDWAVRDLLIPDVKSFDGHQILLGSCYNKPKSEPTPEQNHHCDTRPIWTPWGWGVNRKRLVWLMTNWCTRNPKCFTCNFRSLYQRTRKELFPVLSRI